MTTYTMTINEHQLSLIERALKLLQESNQTVDEDAEETSIMIGMIPMMREEESLDPGTIHGWCY